ncbi:outer membrane protein [Prevotella sp. tc2-28]|uniref:TolC family protein n=1 Tax=Prevotella sp. tc2-28 TaxID=1761888 RepID=UPI0008991FBD|nr:TolC family protein [Prevotella sp. tc2-28]SEA18891.1 outer membrane protein [Prevotella sp. tc2-28]
MKKGLLILAAMTTLTVTAQQKWTLRDCIDYAMQNNITLKQSQLNKQTTTETRKQSQAALFPSLSGSTNQSLGYKPWLNTSISTVNNGTVNTSVHKTYYNGTYGLNASWTVWNGNQNHNQVKANKLSEQQAELTVEQTANTIQEKIAQLYVQILYQTEAIDVCRQSLETSQRNEERGRELVEVGKMSKADLAQLSAQRATAEYDLVQAESTLANYKLQLKQQLEITGDQSFDIDVTAANDQQALTTIPAMTDVYEQALLLRPEIKNTELALKASEVQLKIAKAGHLPTISLTGGFGTSTSSNNSKEWGQQVQTNFDASAGIGVSIPIFDQRKAKTAVNKANIQRELALLDQQDKQKKLYATIEGFWLDAQTNQQKFRAASATVESEQQSYDLLQEQFNLGLKNNVELMTGKTSLLKAQQNKLQSKYLTILNQQLLRFYQGETMTI